MCRIFSSRLWNLTIQVTIERNCKGDEFMNPAVQEFYALLGFELTDIEDDQEALFMETDSDGS